MTQAARLPRRYLRVVANGLSVSTDGGTPARRAAARMLLGIAEDEHVVAFVGRLTPQKAPHRVLELLHDLCLAVDRRSATTEVSRHQGRGTDARLGRDLSVVPRLGAIIAGTGPLEAELRAAEERMGLSGRVRWTGEVADAGPILAAADLVVLPSVWEGLPYVLLEAMAEGTPVLATPVGGVPEVLSGPLAVGCLPWSREGWATAARQLLAEGEARRRWSREAKDRLTSYREAISVEQILAEYGELGWLG